MGTRDAAQQRDAADEARPGWSLAADLSVGRHEGKRDGHQGDREGHEVRFVKYLQGIAYYLVRVPSEDADYVSPVPLSDVGDATLLASDKGLLFMRYIRKAMEDGTFVRAAKAH